LLPAHPVHRALFDRLGGAERIDWSREALDSASVPAKKGGDEVEPNPTDRGKSGTKRHLVVDRGGTPLTAKQRVFLRAIRMSGSGPSLPF